MIRISALAPGLDLADPLRVVNEVGVACVKDVLDTEFRQQLEAEVSTGPFEAMPSQEGRARQEGHMFHLRNDFDAYPRVEQLGSELVQLVHAQGGGLGGCDWEPNEIHVQRYSTHALGITPHLDLKRYRVLVAIVTVVGSARFIVCKDRAGGVQTQWTVAPGDLVLLRAPGFSDHADGRPLHAVSGPPVGHRISVTWRMNSRPAGKEARRACQPERPDPA